MAEIKHENQGMNSGRTQAKIDRKLSKNKAPKDKYECGLYFEVDGSFKFQYKIQSTSKAKLKASQLRRTHIHSNRIVKFSEIEEIKVNK